MTDLMTADELAELIEEKEIAVDLNREDARDANAAGDLDTAAELMELVIETRRQIRFMREALDHMRQTERS